MGKHEIMGGIQILIRNQKYFISPIVYLVAFSRVKFAWANRIFYLCRLGQPPTRDPTRDRCMRPSVYYLQTNFRISL